MKDITDTSKNGYMDQFNEYNYIEEEGCTSSYLFKN